jgi:hypothetical protein
MKQNHSAGSLAFGYGNHSADILSFASGNHSADILGFASGVGGLGRRPGGRFNRVTRDFVPSPGG